MSRLLQRVVANRLVHRPSKVLRLALCRLPAGTAIGVMDFWRVLHSGRGRSRIFLLGRRIGQCRRATRASSPVAIRQEGLGSRRALLDPAGSLAGEKRILSYAQIHERSHWILPAFSPLAYSRSSRTSTTSSRPARRAARSYAPHEQDICPDTLYEDSERHAPS